MTEASAPSRRTSVLHRAGVVLSWLGPVGFALWYTVVIPAGVDMNTGVSSFIGLMFLCIVVAVPAGLIGSKGLERAGRLLGVLGAVVSAVILTAMLLLFAVAYPSDLGWDGPVPFLVVVWVAVGLTWAPFVFRAVRLERIAIVTAWCSTAWLILNALSSM